MSSKSSSSNSKVILGVLGGVALGGAVFIAASKCLKRSSDDDDEKLTIRPAAAHSPTTTTSAVPPSRTAAADRQTSSDTVGMKTAASTEDTLTSQPSTMMMTDYSFSTGGATAADAHAAEGGADGETNGLPPSMAQPDENGMVHFPMLGIDWQLLPGWLANEDAAPMPNVAMIQLLKAEFLEQMEAGPGGMSPVVLIGVEDVTAEGLSINEYREKTKELTLQQLTMMTGGQIQPTVVFDGPMSLGPFTHVIEFALATPFAKLQVLNIIAMAAGVAYCVRLMSPSTEFSKVRAEVTQMVKGSSITPRVLPVPFTQWSYIDVSSTRAVCKVPTNWIVNTAVATSGNLVFAFKTMSTTRQEEIAIYEAESASSVADTASWRETAAADTPAGRLVTYKSGSAGDRRVLSTGTFVIVCSSSGGLTTEDSTLITVAESLRTASNSTQSLRFHSARLGCAFDVDVNGRIFESRIAERTATYHPNGGGDPERAAEGPLLTIRVGDPSNDTDCQGTLKEWKERIQSEMAKSEGAIQDLKSETIQGRECITFTNKDMVESGPMGQREERTAKVIIFLVGIKTVMLRWEASTGAYRRSDRKLQAFLSSFQIL